MKKRYSNTKSIPRNNTANRTEEGAKCPEEHKCVGLGHFFEILCSLKRPASETKDKKKRKNWKSKAKKKKNEKEGRIYRQRALWTAQRGHPTTKLQLKRHRLCELFSFRNGSVSILCLLLGQAIGQSREKPSRLRSKRLGISVFPIEQLEKKIKRTSFKSNKKSYFTSCVAFFRS